MHYAPLHRVREVAVGEKNEDAIAAAVLLTEDRTKAF